MWDKQYFRLVNNVDLHARSAKFHLSCNWDIVGKHSNLNYNNAKVGGDGDHNSNTAGVHMKSSKPVKDCLHLIWSIKMGWWSPNLNNRGYKLLTHLWADPHVFVRVVFFRVSPGIYGCLSLWLIYCAALTIDDVMAGVYKLVSCDDLKDVAQELRNVIYHAYKAE